ncbi:MAG: hypothetical protein Q9227_002751 [Pyrenula ochraceoflavens]
MFNWVKALLDPEEIPQSPASKKKHISPPPKFEMPSDKPVLAPTVNGPTPRARGQRSSSPSKIASPAKKNGSPRKPRQTKAMKEANIANANAASAKLQAELEDVAKEAVSDSVSTDDKVKVEVESSVDVNGETETTHTNVTVEMPAGSPELPVPEDTEKMVETARKMVDAAVDHEAESSTRRSKKRKADAVEDDIDKDLPVQPTKKAKVLQEKLRREQVRNRALVGVSAALTAAHGERVLGDNGAVSVSDPEKQVAAKMTDNNMELKSPSAPQSN